MSINREARFRHEWKKFGWVGWGGLELLKPAAGYISQKLALFFSNVFSREHGTDAGLHPRCRFVKYRCVAVVRTDDQKIIFGIERFGRNSGYLFMIVFVESRRSGRSAKKEQTIDNAFRYRLGRKSELRQCLAQTDFICR